MINAIVACDLNNGIGAKGMLPWHFKSDMLFFKNMTMNQVVVMGKNTWQSLPIKPLPNRKNIILSTTMKNINIKNVLIYNNFDDIVKTYDDIWVIGGEKLYSLSFNHPNFNTLYLTRINKIYEDCDKFLPNIPTTFFNKCIIKKIYEKNTELIFEKYSFFKTIK